MDLNKFAKEVHENAVKHGWWEEPQPSNAEIIALLHSEVSEALQEYRDNRLFVCYVCNEDNEICNPDYCIYDESDCEYRSKSPKGVAVEFVDLVLRILDYCAKNNHNIVLNEKTDEVSLQSIPEIVTYLHEIISYSYDAEDDEIKIQTLLICIPFIIKWFDFNNFVFENVLLIKHEYNKTRSYRHGGKLL